MARNGLILSGNRGGHIPLTRPNSISQLLKAIRKGHLPASPPNRLAAARHRRGKRGHETEGFAR